MQQALFHESLVDAMREAVAQLGGTKTVGAKMRPELSPDHAGRWLADCLNPDRREKLDPDQVLWLMKQARAIGYHGLAGYLLQEAGYQAPAPVEPQDEIVALQREYIESAKAMAKIAERIERVQTLRAVA